MAKKPASSIPRRLDARLGRFVEDVQDLKIRTTHVEAGLAGVKP